MCQGPVANLNVLRLRTPQALDGSRAPKRRQAVCVITPTRTQTRPGTLAHLKTAAHLSRRSRLLLVGMA